MREIRKQNITAGSRYRAVPAAALAIAVTLLALEGGAQPIGGHESHHTAADSPTSRTGTEMGGMMDDGAELRDCEGDDCGPGGTTPIYPSLMALPALTPEKRAELEALASKQIRNGLDRLGDGAAALERAVHAGDHVATQQSIGAMREALDELGAGVAARRVLAEGKPPRNLALEWFRREMNLATPIPVERPGERLGVAALHLFVMVLLVAFALAMVLTYFFKMRRAAELFGRIERDSGTPPPGAAPPLEGPPDSPAPSAGSSGPSANPASVSPLTANWRGRLRVGAIAAETPSVKTVRLLPSPSDRVMPFTFQPGQFLNFSFWIGGARMNRSYSISSSPLQREYVDVTVRREPRGAVSRHIHDLLRVGDPVEVGGPVGRFTFDGTEAESVVLIGGGVGITPLMSITRYLTECSWPGDVFLIYACRAPVDFIFSKEITALQALNPRLHVTVTMERPEGTDWTGPSGRISKGLLTNAVPDLRSRRIHLCGPPLMMDAVKAILGELDVPAPNVKTELFGAPKPALGAASTTSRPVAPATGPLVTFSKHRRSARSRPGQTLLELSEELAIGIQFSCRVGTCGVCRVKMTSGKVEMAVDDALTPDDKATGMILACQARPTSDIAVDA